MRKCWAVMAVLMMLSVACESIRAASPPARKKPKAPTTAREAAVLARQLRTFVLAGLPDPLYEDAKKWGMQKQNRRGKLKNDGRWHKLRITGRNFPHSLQLDIKNLRKTPGRTVFTVVLTFPATILLERQTWRMGLRLYSGSTRARVRVGVVLVCEVQTKVEKTDGWVPDMIIRFRVVHSAFTYTDLVVEHTAGVGGDAAKLLGELMISLVKAAKPNLEEDLKKKANAAILKAGATRQVRISLTDLISGKMPAVPVKPVKKK